MRQRLLAFLCLAAAPIARWRILLFPLLFVLTIGAAASSKKGSATARKCLEDGKKLEARAAPEGPGNQRLFENALQKYLCAARGGNAEGAMAAINLSQSGMAPKLSLDSIRLLSKIAANGGILSGYATLADSYCENVQNCLDPSKAIAILFEGNTACSCKMFSYGIGDIILGAAENATDTAHAYACYKQAIGKGVQKKLNSIIKLSPTIDTTLSCEPIR